MKKCCCDELGSSTVTFGQIQGGDSPYVVPDTRKVTIDMRLVPPLDTQKAEELIKSAIRYGGRTDSGGKGEFEAGS